MDSSGHFTIWRAVFYSALAHGVVFSASIPMLAERSVLDNMVKLEARLHQGAAKGMAMASSEAMVTPEIPPIQDIRREEKAAPKTTRPGLPKADVPAPEAVAVPEVEAVPVFKAAPEAATIQAFDTGLEGDRVSRWEFGEQIEIGLEEYKWALTRAMKGARQYPPTARMQGITGKVITRVVWLPTFAAPQVELAVSSGSSLLDEDALAKFARAVRITPLPEILRARSFELSQTVDYSLE
ncbi:MAG: TonB family protein [Betaproteobacteria bacterium]|nr:TonB family protein [Betaproteobacteria bacterium]